MVVGVLPASLQAPFCRCRAGGGDATTSCRLFQPPLHSHTQVASLRRRQSRRPCCSLEGGNELLLLSLSSDWKCFIDVKAAKVLAAHASHFVFRHGRSTELLVPGDAAALSV
jgi:hypothetical protein